MRSPSPRTPVTGSLRRWLQPGMGVKRWLGLVFIGLLLLALGTAHVIRQVTPDLDPNSTVGVIVNVITLGFLPFILRGLVAGLAGAVLIVVGMWRFIRAVTDPLLTTTGSGEDQPLVEVIYQKRFLARGPKVVAIGGGTGLSTLLRGMKEHTSNLTAIVTVADDGGSSGTLRTSLGIPPVGDIRNCIAALADVEPLMSELLGYRFPGGVRTVDGPVEIEPGGGLGGHAVGNLLIAAMTAVEGGDFEEGVRLMNRVLAVRGQVVPASATPLTLHAKTRDGKSVSGQSTIMKTPGIERVWISPKDVAASDDALAAIADAEIIVLGPGSLFTSVLPVLLIPAIREAVTHARAIRVYASNVATQRGETTGFDLADHVEALLAHTAAGLVDIVLANDQLELPGTGGRPPAVALRWPPRTDPVPHLATDAVASEEDPHHHDPARLAAAILRACEREAATLRRERVARTA
jgi:uncharacterized cofD-like protein